MTVDSRLTKSVPFAALGPDVVLRFRTIDLINLEGEFGGGPDFIEKIEAGLRANDAKTVVTCLKHAAKAPGGFKPLLERTVDWDDLPFSASECVRHIADALTCAISGKPYAALVEERDKAHAAAAEIVERDGGLAGSFTHAQAAE